LEELRLASVDQRFLLCSKLLNVVYFRMAHLCMHDTVVDTSRPSVWSYQSSVICYYNTNFIHDVYNLTLLALSKNMCINSGDSYNDLFYLVISQ